MAADDDKQDNSKARSPVTTVIALGILALVAYQVYSGVAMKKVGLFGMYIDFADKAAESRPEASREFIVGRWQVERDSGQASDGTNVDYQSDGTFSGTMMVFVGGNGVKQSTVGRWQFEKVSTDTFRLRLSFPNQTSWLGTFRIFDRDHIQNVDQNYVAVRMK